jgi:hypothetical protein
MCHTELCRGGVEAGVCWLPETPASRCFSVCNGKAEAKQKGKEGRKEEAIVKMIMMMMMQNAANPMSDTQQSSGKKKR